MNVVSFGGGTNSTAMIIGMYLHKIPIDLILFADTGGEQPHTLILCSNGSWRNPWAFFIGGGRCGRGKPGGFRILYR